MGKTMTLKSDAATTRTQDPFWYKKDDIDPKKGDGFLKGVTSEKSNEALGIKNISVYQLADKDGNPLTKMLDKGAICKVSLDTEVAYIDGITVWNSKNGDGSIYLQMQSRTYQKGEEKAYVNDTRLKKPVQAQILRYVESISVTEDATATDAE
jgi:hypothetical protein